MNKLEIQTLPSLLENSANLYGNNIALSYVNEESLTYNDFQNKVNNTKNLLISQGVKKGDKVAILSRNMPNWGIAFFAISSIGAVVVTFRS
jgi:long-chain acyl-CoA synthetase